MAAFCSSYIKTTTVAVTRGADSYSLPFTTPPQEMTVYAKFVEGGANLAGARVFEIASAADANPRLFCSGGVYHFVHATTLFNDSSTLAAGPAFGDITELGMRLFGDGSVDITQSLNGAAATTAAQSGAVAFGTGWSGLLCWLNSAGTVGAYGFTALQSFKIFSGARSLSEARAG